MNSLYYTLQGAPLTSASWVQDQQEMMQMQALAGEAAHEVLFALKPYLLEARYLMGRVWHCCVVMDEKNTEGPKRGREKINRHIVALADTVAAQEKILEPYGPEYFSRHQSPRLFSIHPFAETLMDFYGACHAVAEINNERIKPLRRGPEAAFFPDVVRQGVAVIGDHLTEISRTGARLDAALPLPMKMGRDGVVFGLRTARCALDGGPGA